MLAVPPIGMTPFQLPNIGIDTLLWQVPPLRIPVPKKLSKITKDEVMAMLQQDGYYRKIKSWPLLTSDSIFGKLSPISTVEDCLSFRTRYLYSGYGGVTTMNDFTRYIDGKHPFTSQLLTKFKGHLVAAGGSIVKTVIGSYYRRFSEDIDLFFYDLHVEQANQMRLDIIQYLSEQWKNNYGDISISVIRNEYVTTIYVYRSDKENDLVDIFTYQLIHRIYPTIDTILGGFDISAAMIAYDGRELYTTPLGCWTLKKGCIIVDTKRRSTSYEYRLCKYNDYGFNIIFPGLPRELEDKFLDNPEKLAKIMKLIEELAGQHGYDICRDDFLEKKQNYDDEELFQDIQRRENILPLLNINDGRGVDRRLFGDHEGEGRDNIRMGTNPYNRTNIEDRFINKISDYSHDHVISDCFPHANATRLRTNNLAAVVSIVNDCNMEKLLYDVDHPNIGFDDKVVEKYKKLVEEVRYGLTTKLGTHHAHDSQYYFYRFSKCFGKLTPEVMKIRETEQYFDYRDVMITTMHDNAKICRNNLIGIKWLT